MKPKIPPLPLSESEWYSLPRPEKALLIAGQFCDEEPVRADPPGSRRGPWIDAFCLLAREDVGRPWSAAFVTACEIFAGKDYYSTHYGEGVRYPASVMSWVEWAKASGRWSRTPRRGRLFAQVKPGECHLGFVSKVYGDGTFVTIEGDTDADGAVGRRERRVESVSGFIDLN